ncbi:MAG: hypothetical protein AUJ12_07910 [Alphaproteobacteria bacterium CG1_02_46_17]|nr:MAG: hypothetical protein AUJ12_07910 [Alphaproteobacteria bacterium CG1_02_46_17]
MQDLPRIFVGTLACGEAEFDECCQAIQNQKNVLVTHHVIRDQPEYEAHNMLWQAWNDQKGSHDLFVKIDADTVLMRDTALADIVALFQNPDVTGAQILMQDYFTDDLIAGLNAFSTAVVFRKSKRKLFADHADTGHKMVLKGDVVRHLAPIAWHGKNPTARQAFHFGFHRQMKRQKQVLRRVAIAWLKHRDAARGWALAGAASVKWWNFGGRGYAAKNFAKSFLSLEDTRLREGAVLKFIHGQYGDLV